MKGLVPALAAAVLVAVVCVSVHYGRSGPVSLMSECVPPPCPARARARAARPRLCARWTVCVCARGLGRRAGVGLRGALGGVPHPAGQPAC